MWAHGYVQWEGTKMSKSAGTAVSLGEAIDRHGPDALRYFLLREVGFEADGNFTWDRFDERYTADLADGLGNLASRSLAMVAKYRDGVVPAGHGHHARPGRARNAIAAYARAMDALDLRGGAEAAWELVRTANLYIQQAAPWALAKAGKEAELDARARARWGARCTGWRCWPARSSRAKPKSSGNPSVSPRKRLTRAWPTLERPPVGRARYQQTRGAVPQAAECLEVSLSMSKTI